MTHREPTIDIKPVDPKLVCVTKGELTDGSVTVPTMRGFALVPAPGDAAQLTFTYRGDSAEARALANGSLRRQIGLKLRAQNSCNVVYVMWRLDPTPKLDVSVKHNPGKATHEECGADGYVKVRSKARHPLPAFEAGATHTLRAEIVGDDLHAWVDGALAFSGTLPASARTFTGPAGLRSDNVAFDLVELSVPQPLGSDGAPPSCKREGSTD
jgi:hypothetical protein